MVSLTTIISWLKLKKQKKIVDRKQVAKADGITAHVQNATIGNKIY